jgi:hypothetical protein
VLLGLLFPARRQNHDDEQRQQEEREPVSSILAGSSLAVTRQLGNPVVVGLDRPNTLIDIRRVDLDSVSR